MAFTASAVWEVQTTGLDDFSTVSATVAVGGTGYSVGNTLTVVGGTSTTTATFTVATVSGGVVLTVTPTNTGHYTVLPANPVATTGGAGTCTLTITWNAGGNGGGFDTGVSGFPTDGVATVANTSAPVFTSASYNFVAGDVGHWIYIKSGTNWTPGWYKISSVAANAATLNGTIGSAVLAAGTPSTVVGCATTASPTSATWGIDYSQSTARIAFTDMVIAITTTNFTSAANPVGKNFVGNIINVTGGVNFTVQRVAIASTSGTTATCDKSLGTAAAVSGTGNMGGPLASPGAVGALWVSGNRAYVKTGTYTLASSTANAPGGTVLVSTSIFLTLEGYSAVRADLLSPPTIINAAFTSISIISQTSGRINIWNIIADGNSQTSVAGFNLNTGNATAYRCTAKNCTNGGFTNGGALGRTTCVLCTATGCSTVAAFVSCLCFGCEAYSNTLTGFLVSICVDCLSYNNSTSNGIGFSLSAGVYAANCVSYGNGGPGFTLAGNTFAVNCIAESNTGVGFTGDNSAGDFNLLLNCATFGNSASTSQQVRPIPSVVALVSSAFINAAGNDFRLNNVTGTGAACRAAGFPGTFPAATATVGYQDIGAVQSRVPWQTLGLSGGIEG